jgi:hypothetical protein
MKLFFEPETVPPLNIPTGLKEERYTEGYNPEMIPTREVRSKMFIMNRNEKLIDSSFSDTELNKGRVNQTIINAKIVAAKV